MQNIPKLPKVQGVFQKTKAFSFEMHKFRVANKSPTRIFLILRKCTLLQCNTSCNRARVLLLSQRVNVLQHVVYKIPYRRARAWPSGCIVQPLGRVRRASKGILHTIQHVVYKIPCRRALGLARFSL